MSYGTALMKEFAICKILTIKTALLTTSVSV